MKMAFEAMGLSNLASGAADEIFQRELAQVLQNVADPNAKAKTKRRITLTVTIVPTEDRARGTVEVRCESKLAPAATLETSVDFVQEGKKQVAYQRSTHNQETGAKLTSV